MKPKNKIIRLIYVTTQQGLTRVYIQNPVYSNKIADRE